MAVFAITKCEPVQVEKQYTGPAIEAIAEGDRCRHDATTGEIALGNATNAAEAIPGGLALHAAAIGEAVTIINRGIVDISDGTNPAGFEALGFGAAVWLDDDDGQLGTAAADGTVQTQVGSVVPGWDATTAQKLLYLNGN